MIKVYARNNGYRWLILPGNKREWLIHTTEKVLVTDLATGASIPLYVTHVPSNQHVCDHCALEASKQHPFASICYLTLGCVSSKMCYKTSDDLLEEL